MAHTLTEEEIERLSEQKLFQDRVKKAVYWVSVEIQKGPITNPTQRDKKNLDYASKLKNVPPVPEQLEVYIISILPVGTVLDDLDVAKDQAGTLLIRPTAEKMRIGTIKTLVRNSFGILAGVFPGDEDKAATL